jgi:hypothetical protein
MRLLKRDVVATGVVAAALILYVLCATEITPSSSTGIRTTGLGVLALGFVASATAVVPSFDQLLHGNKTYLVGMSMAGAIALVAGVHLLVAASMTSLTILMTVMMVLWLAATIHHSSNHPADAARHAH